MNSKEVLPKNPTEEERRDAPVWVEISRGNIRYNWEQIHKVVGPHITVIPMLKSNGYGHGAIPVARELQTLGAKIMGVTSLREAYDLRVSGVHTPLFIADYVDSDNLPYALSLPNTALTISDPQMFDEIESAAKEFNRKVNVHVNVDTGMHREGLSPIEDAVDVIKRIHQSPHINLEGIFTHFATAGDADTSFVQEQWNKFNGCLDEIENNNIPLPPYIHAAEGAGVMRFPFMFKEDPKRRMTAVRPGNIIYGLPPGDTFPFLFEPKRILVGIKAKLAGVKSINKGETVGYGRTWTATENDTTLGIVTSGYTDGLRRSLSNVGHMLIHEEKVPIVGLISMNQTVLHLPHPKKDYKLGDEVIIVGKQGKEEISLEEISEPMGTILFEYLANLNQNRLPRIVVD